MSRQILNRLGYLTPKNTVLFLCDIQERFRPGMKYFEPYVLNSSKLVKAVKILEIPVIATEHYPEKLGKIVKEIDVSHVKKIFPKTLFSMMIPEVESALRDIKEADSVVLLGNEAHICLEQTAMDLVKLGYSVHVAADCTMSRSLEDRALALYRMRDMGCIISTSENIIFKLMRNKNHPAFNEVR